MGTSKHIVILLILALSGILAAGQDQPAASAPSSQPKASNTRFASCIVRITVDPAIMPLSLENIESLLQSSGVAVKAGREVLSLNEMEVFNLPLFKVEWLNASPALRPVGARSSGSGKVEGLGQDWEMLRQMEQIYGADYARQMSGAPDQQKKEEEEGAQTRAAQPAASPQDRPEPTTQRLPGETDVAYRVRLNQMRVKVQQQTKARGMQGMGGMGMGGMVGYGGGMAGRMGGYGGMGFYGTPGLAGQGEGVEQTATVKLVVDLPEDVPPRADEFLTAVVGNLQDSLSQAQQSYQTEIERALAIAKTQHRNLLSELDGTADDVSRVQQQLDQIVDLSALQSQMPLSEAIDVLRRTVEPPLNIMVLWKDLHENVSIEPTSPIGINGMPRVRLGTALDLLVKGLPLGVARPLWRIKNDVVVIGTTAGILGRSSEAAGQPRAEADAVKLAGERSELARRIQALELDLAGLDARREAIGVQINVIREQVAKRLSEDPVMQELEKLVQVHLRATNTPEGRIVTPNSSEGQENLIRVRIQVANRREELSKQAGGSQLEEFAKELSRMAIDKAEKEAQLQIVRQQLDQVQKQLGQALTFDPEAARLRLAREALDITARRVAELQTRLADLQPPMVLVIGANQ